MDMLRNFCLGLVSVIKIIGAPLLYRYPYRSSAEGLRSDWARIGDDINSVLGRLNRGADDGK